MILIKKIITNLKAYALLYNVFALFFGRSWDFSYSRKSLASIVHKDLTVCGIKRFIQHSEKLIKREPKTLFRLIQKVLNKIHESFQDPKESNIRNAITGQVLCKLLATIDLSVGMEIDIPVTLTDGSYTMARYKIDTIFNLWKKIPGYGLIAEDDSHPPILLFRTTSTTFKSEFKLASIAGSLHPKGPSWSLYEHSKEVILKWLNNNTNNNTRKSRVIGYSQGGALALYLTAFHGEYFSKDKNEPSLVFDCPGVSIDAVKSYHENSKVINLQIYLSSGDIIPKFGLYLFGSVFEVDTEEDLSPMEAHRSLTLLKPKYSIFEIDILRENNSPFRKMITEIRKNTDVLPLIHGKLVYFLN